MAIYVKNSEANTAKLPSMIHFVANETSSLQTKFLAQVLAFQAMKVLSMKTTGTLLVTSVSTSLVSL